MRRTNLEFMIGWLDALRRDDLRSLKGMLDDGVVWHGLREEWSCYGPDAVADTFVGERDARHGIDSLELLAAQGHAVVHASGSDVTAVDDFALPDGIYNVFEIQSGRVVRIEDFADRGEALAAAGLA